MNDSIGSFIVSDSDVSDYSEIFSSDENVGDGVDFSSLSM